MPKADKQRSVNLRSGDRIAIVAGSGQLPVDLAESLAELGHSPFVLLIEGESATDSPLFRFDSEYIALEDFPHLAKRLKSRGVTHVVLAGGVGRRPKLRAIKPSLALLRLLPRALAAFSRGDDGILRAMIDYLEQRGVKVVGAHEVVPDLLASEGPLTAVKPIKGDQNDLDAALTAARAIGALDIGQGAVAIGGRAIALEGIEGTDGLLSRVKELRSHGRLAGKERGVLVKCAKRGQELRVDLPTIGPSTVVAAHAAGLAGIGVEAERSLVLDFAGVVQQADKLGLFVVGLPREKAQ